MQKLPCAAKLAAGNAGAALVDAVWDVHLQMQAIVRKVCADVGDGYATLQCMLQHAEFSRQSDAILAGMRKRCPALQNAEFRTLRHMLFRA